MEGLYEDNGNLINDKEGLMVIVSQRVPVNVYRTVCVSIGVSIVRDSIHII